MDKRLIERVVSSQRTRWKKPESRKKLIKSVKKEGKENIARRGRICAIREGRVASGGVVRDVSKKERGEEKEKTGGGSEKRTPSGTPDL